MKILQVLIILYILANLCLLLGHSLNINGGVGQGWFFAKRVSAGTYFDISGAPFIKDSWSAQWGRNRPSAPRPHWIISEVNLQLLHENREGLVYLTITGDSPAEIDAVRQMVLRDFASTYSGSANPSKELMPPAHGHVQEETPLQSTYFWRQQYLWLLIANLAALFILLLFCFRSTLQRKDESKGQLT